MQVGNFDYYIKYTVACTKCYSEVIKKINKQKEIYICKSCGHTFTRKDHVKKLQKLRDKINAKGNKKAQKGKMADY